MCMCEKPTINGQLGYRWNNPSGPSGVHPVNEAGRCGGIDSHCHHYRVVKRYGALDLLVRHGGGEERIRLSLYKQQQDALAVLESNHRYWMLNAIYHAHSNGARDARDAEASRWRIAAAEKRIKVRRSRYTVTVQIQEKIA
jgi:hypothetical protein